MVDLLTFIKEYWFIIIIVIAIISVISIKIYNWIKQPTEEQIKQVQEWLLYAVAKAEEVLGSGTGQLKLRYVYDMFVSKFPAIAVFISFETFTKMVDKALDEFKELLQTNPAINDLYDKWETIEEPAEEEQSDE